MLRAGALAFVAMMLLVVAAAHAEPGQTTPTIRPSIELETAMPDDDDTVVRPAPHPIETPKFTPTPSASPSVRPSR